MKIEIIEIINSDESVTESVVIDNENGSFTSMLKSTYDEMIAAQSTPIVTEDE